VNILKEELEQSGSFLVSNTSIFTDLYTGVDRNQLRFRGFSRDFVLSPLQLC
jgi:hypothetical protein